MGKPLAALSVAWTLLIAVICSCWAPSFAQQQQKIPPQPDTLRVPPGFNISVYAGNLPSARSITSAAVNGATVVYVGSSKAGNVYYLVDRTGDGKPDYQGQLLSRVESPNGVTIRGDDLYLSGFADGKGIIWRLDNVHDYALQNKPYTGKKTVITDRLPGDPGHGLRFLRFGPDGLLVLGIGAPCNVCELETTPEGVQFGTLYALNVTDGRLQRIATGVRNSVGFDWHPVTGILYFSDNGRDKIGDDRPDCELNRLPSRTYDTNDPPFYGFPYCQTQGVGNPYQRDLGPGVPLPDPDENLGNSVINCSAPGTYIQPVQAMGPHTAPLGLRFYRWHDTPAAFPESYNNSIFIVQRGSWNRAMEIGKRVMLLQLDASGRPVDYEQLAWGWLQNENTPQQYAWGRPVDIEQLPDGSMVVSDDTAGMLYRITYTGGSDNAQGLSDQQPSRIEDSATGSQSATSDQQQAGVLPTFLLLLCTYISFAISHIFST